MVRVNFTADDVARTRFGSGPVPLIETVLALLELQRPKQGGSRAASASWAGKARAAFPVSARPLLGLLGPRPPWPDFWNNVVGDLDQGLDAIRVTAPGAIRADLASGTCPRRPSAWLRALADGDRAALDIVVRGLRDLHDAVVAPRWGSILRRFHADIAARMALFAAGGSEALLGTLHPQLRWRDGGLDRQGASLEFQLRGTGIVLMPSASWTGPPAISFGAGDQGTAVLMYPARPGGYTAILERDGTNLAVPSTLAALLGPTRAAVLCALRKPSRTIDLADAAQISAASASEHAKVLREANLILTRREGRSVRHALTSLGIAMLDSSAV